MKKLYVVGIGPGAPEMMTLEAKSALDECEVIAGYSKYIELIEPVYPDKEKYSTGMTGEIERCEKALEFADAGKTTAVICSGDAGVYGMASPILELAEKYPEVEVEIIAGVTAALSGAAVLGAPLGHDFCVISLSDRLTAWDVIEKRLRCAAEADMCLAVYNPTSKTRHDFLERARDILLEFKSPETCCGLVKNIGRAEESYKLFALKDMKDSDADMFTTVFVGNSTTRVIGGKLVTLRGYNIE